MISVGCSIFRGWRTDHGFQHTSQLASRHHHTPLAAQAFQPNISPQSGDFPLGTAAGVLFSQPENIVKVEFR